VEIQPCSVSATTVYFENPEPIMKKLHQIASLLVLLGLSHAAQAQIAIVASQKSNANTITAEQASALFLGKSDQLPGGGTALLLDLPESSPARDTFYSKVTGKSQSQVKASWARLVFSGKGTPPKELPNSAEVKRLVAANPNLIGYVEKGAVDGSVKVLLSVE